MIKTVSIAGLGLIGGSIARAIREKFPEIIITAFDKPDVIETALCDKVIDDGTSQPELLLFSDIIFLCLPPDCSIDLFKKLVPELKPGQIITDVCGVKGIFQKIWDEQKSEGIYFGGHPMTGKECGGYKNSDSLIFKNSRYILNKNAENHPAAEDFRELIKSFGAEIVFLEPEEHDRIVAAVSHLPQLFSVAFMDSFGGGREHYINYAAGGFRDMTRIAASPFNIWESVIGLNKSVISESIDLLIESLKDIKTEINKPELTGLEEKFKNAAELRNIIPLIRKGFRSELFSFSLFVEDKPGELNRITSLILNENVNLKDIELLNINEGNGGVFRLSFDNRSDMEKIVLLLKPNGNGK